MSLPTPLPLQSRPLSPLPSQAQAKAAPAARPTPQALPAPYSPDAWHQAPKPPASGWRLPDGRLIVTTPYGAIGAFAGIVPGLIVAGVVRTRTLALPVAACMALGALFGPGPVAMGGAGLVLSYGAGLGLAGLVGLGAVATPIAIGVGLLGAAAGAWAGRKMMG